MPSEQHLEHSSLIPVQPGYDLSIQINIERKDGGYTLRCHGANGTATIGPMPSLPMALDELAYWATNQAKWNREQA